TKRGTAGQQPYRKHGTPKPRPKISLTKPRKYLVEGNTFADRMARYREIYEAAQKKRETA
ncbi:hypothetical protein, partial [Nocardia rhamnosiphila]